MSLLNSIYVACENLQGRVLEYWGNNNNLLINDPIPFYEFLLSPENTNGINQTINPGNGKTRSLNLIYDKRIQESAVTTVSGRPCNPQAPRPNFVETYEMDTADSIYSGEQIDIAQLAVICENNDQFIAQKLAQHLDAIDRKAATIVAEQAIPLVGNYSDDAVDAYSMAADDTLVVQTRTADGNINVEAWEQIYTAATMSGLNSFIGFGGQLMQTYMNLSMAGCCSNQGLDLGQLYNLYGRAYGYDRRLATAIGSGATDSLFMEVGALQLLYYTAFPAYTSLGFNSPYQRFNSVTPRGLPVDVLIQDDCGVFNISVYATIKLVGKPADLFLAGDNFEGVRGTGFVTVTNP